MRQRLLSLLLCFTLATGYIGYIPETQANTGIRKTFRLSAYYSPLPGQSFYAMGSYEAEIRMNGRGISGASGVAVYPGMLAAPKSYAFGTKIDLDGMGVGTVWDRGGAIVQAGERGQAYDRIDVWMGHGEEGLKKALTFGKRTVSGTVYPPGSGPEDSLDLQKFPILPGLGSKKSNTNSSPWTRSLHVGVSGSDVHELQEALQTLGYFKESPTGNYGTQTEHAVLAFQQAHRIVQTRNDHGAGVFGPSTRKKLEEVLADPTKKNTPAPAEPQISEEKLVENQGSLQAPIILGNIQNKTPLTFGVPRQHLQTLASHTVLTENELLQYELRKRSYYGGEINGEFNEETRTALIAFQISSGIISSASEYGAGVFGPQTKNALAQEVHPELPEQTQVTVEIAEETELEHIDKLLVIEEDQLPMMSPGDSGEYVEELQKELQRIQLYSGNAHGVYDEETAHAITLYQLAHNLISDAKEQGSGYFGPKTSVHFNEFRRTAAFIAGGRILEKPALQFNPSSSANQYLEKLLEVN